MWMQRTRATMVRPWAQLASAALPSVDAQPAVACRRCWAQARPGAGSRTRPVHAPSALSSPTIVLPAAAPFVQASRSCTSLRRTAATSARCRCPRQAEGKGTGRGRGRRGKLPRVPACWPCPARPSVTPLLSMARRARCARCAAGGPHPRRAVEPQGRLLCCRWVRCWCCGCGYCTWL